MSRIAYVKGTESYVLYLTSNLIESVHADVNQEGVGCTLVGTVIKGQAFDIMKMKNLKVLVLFLHYQKQPQ